MRCLVGRFGPMKPFSEGSAASLEACRRLACAGLWAKLLSVPPGTPHGCPSLPQPALPGLLWPAVTTSVPGVPGGSVHAGSPDGKLS